MQTLARLPRLAFRFLTVCLSLQAASTQILDGATDKFINDLMQEWGFASGLSVAVVQRQPNNTWLTETKGYGIANAKGDPVDGDTLFSIGSNSKFFDALAAGLLISNTSLSRRIDWDTKLADLIPSWGLMDPIASAETTIVDCMAHRTGLPRHELMYRKEDSLETILKRLKYLKPSAPFRSINQYTSIMYTPLSMLPSLLIPGATFENYVKSNIFDKLGMKSTTYDYFVANASGKMANGFGREGVNLTRSLFDKGIPRALPYWNQANDSYIDGAGGIISSGNDLTIWLKALLLSGKNPTTGESVIPSDVILQTMSGASILVPVAPYPEMSPWVYGGGQAQFSYRGQLIVEHNGGDTGFLTRISWLPYAGVGLAVLSNDGQFGDALFDAVKFHLIDKILLPEQPAIDWKSRLTASHQAQYDAEQALPAPPPVDKTKPPLKPFDTSAGVYNNPGYKDIELCYIPSDSSKLSAPSSESKSCKAVRSNATAVLPDLFDRPRRDMFIVQYPHIFFSHIVFEHFDGNLFNISIWDSRPTIDDPKQAYWAANTDYGGIGEFALSDQSKTVGLALGGDFWGGTSQTPLTTGRTVEQKAEVWFEKVR